MTNIKHAITASARAARLIGRRAPEFKARMTHRTRPIAAAVLLALGAQGAHAASVTYIVGTCVKGTQFASIQSALNASPAPTTVEVCPGVYAEQLNIKRPVTLEGITAANGAEAEIVLPGSGTINAVLKDEGENAPAVAQVYVNNVTGGTVNLSNLTVNGANFTNAGVIFVGIVYQQSSGTINHVITASQDGNAGVKNVVGWGLWIDGGSTNPTVTVENSSFNAFSFGGIFATGETESGEDVTVNIHNNLLNAATEGAYVMVLEEGVNATVSGNVISGGIAYGIFVDAPKGSISGNTIINSSTGIELAFDGPSVTSNTIYNAQQEGIDVSAPTLKVGKVENNTINSVGQSGSTDASGTGIDLNCNSYGSSQINSNTVINAAYGYGDARAGFSTSGNNYGVDEEIGQCLNPAARSQHVTAVRAKLQAQLQGHQED